MQWFYTNPTRGEFQQSYLAMIIHYVYMQANGRNGSWVVSVICKSSLRYEGICRTWKKELLIWALYRSLWFCPFIRAYIWLSSVLGYTLFSVLSGLVSMDPSSSPNGSHGRQIHKQPLTSIVLSFKILSSELGLWRIHLVFQWVFVAAGWCKWISVW